MSIKSFLHNATDTVKKNAVMAAMSSVMLASGLLSGNKVNAQNQSDNDNEDRSIRKNFSMGVNYSDVKDIGLKATNFYLNGGISIGKKLTKNCEIAAWGEVGYHTNHLGYGGRASYSYGNGSGYYEWAEYDNTAFGRLGAALNIDVLDDDGYGIMSKTAFYGQATSYPGRRAQDIAQCDIGAGFKERITIGLFSKKGWELGVFGEYSKLLVNHKNQTQYGRFNQAIYEALGTYPAKELSKNPPAQIALGINIGF
jgi:hypothetical protein